MATVVVRAPGQAARTTTHRKALLKLGTEVLTLPIASREVQISEISPEWVQIPRPGQRPLLRRANERLRQVQIEVVFVKPHGHVEFGLQILRRFANHGSPVAFSYGPSESGFFHITDLRVRSVQREFGTNNITQAEVALTLTEALPDGYKKPEAARPAPAAPAKSAPKPAPAKKAGTPKDRKSVV